MIELSSWVRGDDSHWMATDDEPGLHLGIGPQPDTCTICRDGCDWYDCGEPPTETLTGDVVIERPATLFDDASEVLEPWMLYLCATHAERVKTEPTHLFNPQPEPSIEPA